MNDHPACQNEQLLARLAKLEGQIRGVRRMVEEGRTCEEVIIQLSAISSGVTNTAKLFLQDHIAHCVVDGLEHGDTAATIEELQRVVDQYFKMKK